MKRSITLTVVLPLLLSLGCTANDALQDVAQEPGQTGEETVPDAVEADPRHYTTEFENDALLVIRIAYGPGERSVMHAHPANCVVFLTDARFTMTPQSGEATTSEDTRGTVACGDAGVHLPENVADAEAEAIMIAFRDRETFDAGAAGPPVTGYSDVPDAVTADPEHYTVEFENDLVRLVRIRYGVGEASVMHAHPAGCAVFLTEQSAQFTMADGAVSEASDQPGDVTCGAAEVHLPENTGTEPFELILVELKNRETF